jgi:hypothetical protein
MPVNNKNKAPPVKKMLKHHPKPKKTAKEIVKMKNEPLNKYQYPNSSVQQFNQSAWLQRYCSKVSTAILLQTEEARIEWLQGLVLSFRPDELSPLVVVKKTPPPPSDALLEQLSCSKLADTARAFDVNFFSTAFKTSFEDMLLLYAHFALSSNANSVVEMVVRDRASFIHRNYYAFSYLIANSNNSLCVREQNIIFRTLKFKSLPPNSIRFLEVPTIHATYVYMADTDILLTESVLSPKRMKQMERNRLPYSNIIRPNTTRLTGVMLVHTYVPTQHASQG